MVDLKERHTRKFVTIENVQSLTLQTFFSKSSYKINRKYMSICHRFISIVKNTNTSIS